MLLTFTILVASLAISVSASPFQSVQQGTVPISKIQKCSQGWFDPKVYDCYGEGVLCPKLAGTPRLPCGEDCYSKFQYKCDMIAGKLLELERKDSSTVVQLTAHNPALGVHNGNIVQACGRHFWLQDGPACKYCPQVVIDAAGRCPAGESTYLGVTGGMHTTVPGGQGYYVEKNGALGFTQAHSGSRPEGVTSSTFEAFEGGSFLVTGLINWLACPSTQPGKHYQIFAPLPDVKFSDDCIPATLLIMPYSGEPVWQYV